MSITPDDGRQQFPEAWEKAMAFVHRTVEELGPADDSDRYGLLITLIEQQAASGWRLPLLSLATAFRIRATHEEAHSRAKQAFLQAAEDLEEWIKTGALPLVP